MLLSGALALTLWTARVPRAPALYLQRAQADLTPPESLPLGGYTKRGGKVADPGGEALYSRVAVLSQGNLKVAVVSLEMLTVPESLVREVRSRLPSDLNLFMVATHTHCAPDSQMLNDRMTMAIPGIASYKERWLDWYGQRIARSIEMALSARRERLGSLEVARFEPKLNRSRRPYGAPDPWATAISANGKPLFFVYAAHATILDDKHNQTAGDWPGELMRRSGALVFPGAIGDVSPSVSGSSARAVSDYVTGLLRSRRGEAKRLAPRLSFSAQPIALGEPELHPEFPKANGIPETLARRLLDRFAPREAIAQTLGLGDIKLVGVPGEPTSHVGRSIVGSDSRRVVISHCNGWIGYIVDPTDYWLGGYEATLTMYGPLTGRRVVEACRPMP